MKTISTALKQIRRTPYQSLIAVIILSLSFFVLAIFSLVLYGSNQILSYFEKSPQVIAFFEKGKDLPETDILRIQQKLEATGYLSDFKYVSTKEAEIIYKEKNVDEPLLNELVDYKILPPSIEISATSIAYLPELKNILEAEPMVTDLVFYEDITNQLSTWINNVRYGGLLTVFFLLFLSIIILSVIISLKIKNKHKQITTMRLLGASKWYVNGPFIIESMIYGFWGAVFGWLAMFTALQYATPYLLDWLGEIINLPIDMIYLFVPLAIMSLSGMILGAFSALIAVRRFIKV